MFRVVSQVRWLRLRASALISSQDSKAVELIRWGHIEWTASGQSQQLTGRTRRRGAQRVFSIAAACCWMAGRAAPRELPRVQLAAAAADHVSLRHIDLRRVRESFLTDGIGAGGLLDGSRQGIAIEWSEAVLPLPHPDFLIWYPEETAKKVLVRFIDAQISRPPRDKLDAPLRAVAEADHIGGLRRRSLTGRSRWGWRQGIVRRRLRHSRGQDR